MQLVSIQGNNVSNFSSVDKFANVVMSAATAFDVQNEITQFCQERGSKLARVSRGPDEASRGSVDSRQDSILAPSERSFSQPTGRPEKRSSRGKK